MSEIAVLIVDDNEEDRYLLMRQLRETGLKLHIFEEQDGRAALEFFADHQSRRTELPDRYPPQVVFLDINMPLLDGYGFLKEYAQLRQQVDGIGSAVVMYSSSEEQAEKQKAFEYDFVKDYLVKGKFTSKQLKDRLLNVV
jgi:CheY-like chemotaxis protein